MEHVVTVHKGRIVSGGRLQLPADVRRELGLSDGDPVRMSVENGELRVRSLRAVIAGIQAEMRRYVPEGASLADELIADRRADAARE
jgi:bifunctional DNA-binding transcriptional regulator/antitoxin component of YhaV-PrlF toxin-antitoxin module